MFVKNTGQKRWSTELLQQPQLAEQPEVVAKLRESARKKRRLVERDVVTQVIEADTRERDR